MRSHARWPKSEVLSAAIGPVAVGLLASWAVWVWAVSASAAETSEQRSAAYSIGQRGNRLKWLPYRPGQPRKDYQVVMASHSVSAESAPRLQTAQQMPPSPFQDPFGDSLRRPLPMPSAETLDDALLKKPQPQPPATDSLPDFPPMQPPPLDGGTTGEGPSQIPPLEELTAQGPVDLGGKCPLPDDPDFYTPIEEIRIDITPSTEGGEIPKECSLGEKEFQPRAWAPTTFTWKATGLCHKPLYFEDVHLERYGHSWGPYLQPFISGGHFFLTIPVLPYKMGLEPPGECIYTLGYYRPGSCAPYLLDPLPLSVRAGLAQAAVWTGGVYVFP
ncbi:MAG: hypothetical protein JXB62_13210 [Pirellulales bacterium]|nr:hypothetical protein [Pirellulales bacterium]